MVLRSNLKVPPPGLRQFLATESPLKMMNNAFYFILKANFVHRYLNFCPDLFGRVGKRHHLKAKVAFKIYDVIN